MSVKLIFDELAAGRFDQEALQELEDMVEGSEAHYYGHRPPLE